jgi:hypothetical protein
MRWLEFFDVLARNQSNDVIFSTQKGHSLGSLKSLSASIKDFFPERIEDYDPKWLHYTRHNYWTRAWITQEIALARNLQLLVKERMIEKSRLPVFHMPFLREVGRLSRNNTSLIELL